MEKKYYDGTKLLSLQDLNGRRPEIYMCTTNRTAGKTTYFNKLVFSKWLKGQGKFGLVYRYKDELDGAVADRFFKDIGPLFFPGITVTARSQANGKFIELFAEGMKGIPGAVSCGYAVAINGADDVKKNSHLLSDIDRMVFDEFESETNHYCPREIEKLMSVHTSIARGQGKQIRYVPIYMLGNCISLINPYFVEMGITERLRDDTVFLRGDGFVLEQNFYAGAAKAQLESGFNRALSKNKYLAYQAQNIYLRDNNAFVEKPAGKGRYLGTIKYEGTEYGLREYAAAGVIYCDNKPDSSFPFKLALTTEDHNINYVMLKQNETFIKNMRYFFDHGAFRFKDLKSKEVVLKMLAYR
jgi:hypothetical protein